MIVEKEVKYVHKDLVDLYTGQPLKVVYRDDGSRPSYSCPEATSLLVPMPRAKLLELMATRDGIINKANATETFICPYSGALLRVVDVGPGQAIAVGGVNLRNRLEDPFTLLYNARMRKGVPAQGTIPNAPAILAGTVNRPPTPIEVDGDGVSNSSKDLAARSLKILDKTTRVTVQGRKKEAK
jgi:hypothetical protein